MREPIVVLPPDSGSHQDIQRRNVGSPGKVITDREPLRMLVEHRIDNMDERFVRRDEAVPSCEQIAFEHALDRMFTQHLDDAAVGSKLSTIRIFWKVVSNPELLAHRVDVV